MNTTAFALALVVTIGYYFFSVRKWEAEKDKRMNLAKKAILKQKSKEHEGVKT